MDCCDAICSRRDLAERQRILKDSHVGAFAVIGLVIWALFSFAAACDITLSDKVTLWDATPLILIPVFSRGLSVLKIWTVPPLSTSQYAKSQKDGNKTETDDVKELGAKNKNTDNRSKLKIILAFPLIAFILIFALIIFFKCLNPWLMAIILIENLAHMIVCDRAIKNLGGMSGDISGFAITISETAAIITMAFLV